MVLSDRNISFAGVYLRALAALHKRLRPRAMRAPLPPHAPSCIYGFQVRSRCNRRFIAQPQQRSAAVAAAHAGCLGLRRSRACQRQRGWRFGTRSDDSCSQRDQTQAVPIKEFCSGQLACRRQGRSRRSRRHLLFANCLGPQEADDAFDDLEDFLWQPGMPL